MGLHAAQLTPTPRGRLNPKETRAKTTGRRAGYAWKRAQTTRGIIRGAIARAVEPTLDFVTFPALWPTRRKKNEHWGGERSHEFINAWGTCPRCEQLYRNDLGLDIANAFVSFVDEKYPGNSIDDQVLKMRALRNKLCCFPLMDRMTPSLIGEAKRVANSLLSLIGQMNAIVPSHELLRYEEAYTYNSLGLIFGSERSEGADKMAVACFKKCLDKCGNSQVGQLAGEFAELARSAECNVTALKARLNGYGVNGVSAGDQVAQCRKRYQQMLERYGDSDVNSLLAGMSLANALYSARLGLESERFLTTLAATSKRIHGPGHLITMRINSSLETSRERLVWLGSGGKVQLFELLRYEDDGKTCMVQGPIVVEPRNRENEETAVISVERIRESLCGGTPVVCFGLAGASSHLNGKIAEVRDRSDTCYHVHFEDKGLKSCDVEFHNVRVAFELPPNGE